MVDSRGTSFIISIISIIMGSIREAFDGVATAVLDTSVLLSVEMKGNTLRSGKLRALAVR